MDNATATISILDRALKGRNRRDRDGKNRRPVTDGLIEYAKELRDENAALSAKIIDLEHNVAIRDGEIEALDVKIIELKKEILALSPSSHENESAAAE